MGKAAWGAVASIASILFGAGLELSGLEIPYLGYGLMAAGALLGVVLVVLSMHKRGIAMNEEGAERQEDSPGAMQFGDYTTIEGDVAGRDIDKSTHMYSQPLPQPITPVLEGEIRSPNIFVKITNTDSLPHLFKVVFHDVSGMAGQKRVKEAWLHGESNGFQMVGPKQSDIIQVAQADGESRDLGKVIRFMHNKGSKYDTRLSEYVAFGGKLQLDLEIQSDAELGIEGRKIWTLKVDNKGTPISFEPQ